MVTTATTGYHHVSLSVRDLASSAAWYERVLDLDPVLDEDANGRQGKVYRLRGTSAMFGLVEHSANDGAPFRPDRTGVDHVAFAVATRDEMDVWASRLDALDVAHSGVIEIPVGAILNFADPDGIALSVFWEDR